MRQPPLFGLVLVLGACANDLGSTAYYSDASFEAPALDGAASGDGADVFGADVFGGEEVSVDSALSWHERVELLVDEVSLTQHFERNGGVPRYAVDIYAVAIEERPGGLAYRYFDVNKGAFSQAFWPASTIKIMACLAALSQVHAWGFTGDASARWSGFSDSVRAIVDRAVRTSSNADYDRCLQIAGHDYVNGQWLSDASGFPTTVLKASYARLGVIDVPPFSLSQDSLEKDVPARRGQGSYNCDGGGNNCTTLYELVEALRRLHLSDELPDEQRFDVDSADRVALADASCGATVKYFERGAKRILGEGTQVCSKAGWVPGNDYLDHALVTAPNGLRFLIAAAVPDGGSPAAELEAIAERVAEFFSTNGSSGEYWLQPGFGEQPRLVRNAGALYAVGGASVRVFVEGVFRAMGPSPLALDDRDLPGRWLALEALDAQGELIGVRHAELRERQP